MHDTLSPLLELQRTAVWGRRQALRTLSIFQGFTDKPRWKQEYGPWPLLNVMCVSSHFRFVGIRHGWLSYGFCFAELECPQFWHCGKCASMAEMRQKGFAVFPTRYKKKDKYGGMIVKRLVILWFMWNTFILYFTILHYTALYYTTLYFTLLHYTTLHYTTLHYTILYYTILYYTILYYTILYYTILYYTILYYTSLKARF